MWNISKRIGQYIVIIGLLPLYVPIVVDSILLNVMLWSDGNWLDEWVAQIKINTSSPEVDRINLATYTFVRRKISVPQLTLQQEEQMRRYELLLFFFQLGLVKAMPYYDIFIVNKRAFDRLSISFKLLKEASTDYYVCDDSIRWETIPWSAKSFFLITSSAYEREKENVARSLFKENGEILRLDLIRRDITNMKDITNWFTDSPVYEYRCVKVESVNI